MICFVYKMKKNNLKFETKNGKNLDKFLKLDSADKCILKATNTCLSCNGYANGGDRKNPVIVLHGSSYKVRRYKRIMELRNQKKGFKHLLPQRSV